MRLAHVRFDGRLFVGAALDESGIVDLARAYAHRAAAVGHEPDPAGSAAALLPSTLEGYLRGGPEVMERARRTAEYARTLDPTATAPDGQQVLFDLDQVTLEAPLPSMASRIFCTGGNFADHLAGVRRIWQDQHDPEEVWRQRILDSPIWGFYKLPQTVVGPGADVPAPGWVKALDYELELAAYIGVEGRNLTPAQAEASIAGYTCFNDWSIRDTYLVDGITDFDEGVLSFAFQKNAPGASLGPFLVADPDMDPYALKLQTRVNGRVRQSCVTGDMVFKLHEVAAEISRFLTLYPGDIIASGTCAGTAFDSSRVLEEGEYGPGELRVAADLFLKDGDVVEGTIDQLGTLTNRIRFVG